MQRALGNMETALAMTAEFAPMTVAAILRLDGAPPPAQVRAGLDELQRRHPLLRARMVRTRRRRFFDGTEGVPPIPLTVLERTHDDQWQHVATQVLNRTLDTARGPMLECTYLQSPADGQADVVFAYHHAIMDGTSAANLFDELLTWCADAGTDGTAPATTATEPAGTTFPPSIDELIPDTLRGRNRIGPLARYLRAQARDEFDYRRAIKGRQPAIPASGSCRIETRSLSVEATNALVGHARRKRLTTNSVVSAALLAATYDQLHAGDTVPMRAIGFADLRNDLERQPPPDVLGCYIAMLRHTLPVGPADDVWRLAASLQAQVRDSIARQEHLLAGGMAKQLMTMILGVKRMRMADTALSYAGPSPIAARYGDIRVHDIHGYITTNRLAPETSALVQIVHGRLTWDFAFFDGDFDAEQRATIADNVHAKLMEASR